MSKILRKYLKNSKDYFIVKHVDRTTENEFIHVEVTFYDIDKDITILTITTSEEVIKRLNETIDQTLEITRDKIRAIS